MEDLNWDTIFYWHYRAIFNHSDIIGLKICRIRWKKTLNKGYGVQGHRGRYTNRKPVCDFLIVINSNWHPISYRFGVIAAFVRILDTAFLSHPLEGGGLGTTYDVHLGLIGKRVVDFLSVLIDLFSLGVTAEALRANICSKSAIYRSNGGQLTQNVR